MIISCRTVIVSNNDDKRCNVIHLRARKTLLRGMIRQVKPLAYEVAFVSTKKLVKPIGSSIRSSKHFLNRMQLRISVQDPNFS